MLVQVSTVHKSIIVNAMLLCNNTFYTIKIKKVKLNVLSETRGETMMTVDPELKN